MRIVFFARAQEAVPMYMVFKKGSYPNVCLLMGGMPPDMVARQVEQFDEDENGVMIATGAHYADWQVKKEAAVFFLEDNFVPSKGLAACCVNMPSFDPPTPEDLLAMIAREYAERERQAYRDKHPAIAAPWGGRVALPAPEYKKPKRVTSSRVCPNCGGRHTKIFHLNTGKYECQICKHHYYPPRRKGSRD